MFTGQINVEHKEKYLFIMFEENANSGMKQTIFFQFF